MVASPRPLGLSFVLGSSGLVFLVGGKNGGPVAVGRTDGHGNGIWRLECDVIYHKFGQTSVQIRYTVLHLIPILNWVLPFYRTERVLNCLLLPPSQINIVHDVTS